jgi:hypothetical protein
MGYGIYFGEPTVHLESMRASSSSDQSTVLVETSNCTHFEEGCGPSSEVSEKIGGVIGECNGLTEFDAASFLQEKAGPIMEVALENVMLESDVTGVLKEKTGVVEAVSHAELSCTEIDSTVVALEKYNPVEVLDTVSPGVTERLLPPLVNGSIILMDNSEGVNTSKGGEVTRISEDDASLADAFRSDPSTIGGIGFGVETPGIDMDSSANTGKGVDTTVVLEEKVGLNPPGLVLPSVNAANKDESSRIQGTNSSSGELDCNLEKVALTNTSKEKERKPKPSELIVFTRRNPKRSATHAESDLNIDRLTRISNRSRKLKKDKETFDPTVLVRMIQDPNLTTKKRKPMNRRDKVSVWGEIDNLSQIIDLGLEFCKLKQERDAEEKKQKNIQREKMDGKSKIQNQFIADFRHLKQEGVSDRDMDSTLTHEISSAGHENVQKAINERDTADPGSSPDSVVYNPLSCEANPVELQQKQSTKNKKKKKNKGEDAKPSSRRGGFLNVSGNENQGTLYWFQVDKKGRPTSNGKREEKGQDMSAPGVTRKETGNTPDLYNGVTIASLSGIPVNGNFL